MSHVDRVLAVVLGGVVLLACGACSQPWKFARAEHPIPGTQATGILPYATPDVPAPWERSRASVASFDSFSGVPPGIAAGSTAGGPAFEVPQGPVFDPVAPVWPDAPCAPPGFGTRLRSSFQEGWTRIRSDYRNYYSCVTMRDLWLGVGGGAVLANTSLDEDFQGWYQRDVRSSSTDDFATFWKPFGEGWIFVPAYAGLALVGGIFEDRPLVGGVGEFGDRVTRGYLVGVPPMVLMQYLLGGSRPTEPGLGSQWKPFDDDNGVSGHAFIGAVPFITAAKMCQNPWMKATLYTFSTLPAWSRFNDDTHYLSQACLGWWMAYLACRAVDDTQQEDRCLTFTPLVTPEVAGVGLVVRR